MIDVKINEVQLRNVVKKINALGGATIRVGVAGELRENIAKYLEFGTKNMPARPFLRPTLLDELVLKRSLKKAIKGWLQGEGNIADNLKDILVGEVRKYIRDLKPGVTWKGIVAKPLKPATIKNKPGQSDKLLVSSNDLLSAIAGEVKR